MAFEPQRAREFVRRIERCHTPKHGSRLRIAGCDSNAMTRQGPGGHPIRDLDELRRRIAACSTDVYVRQNGVEWGWRSTPLTASS